MIFRTELTVSLKFQYSAECKSIDGYNVCVCMCSGMHGGLGPTPNCLCGPTCPRSAISAEGDHHHPGPRLCLNAGGLCTPLCVCVCVCISAVKQINAINHIQNKSFCLHNICVCTVYIYYVYINTHTHTHTHTHIQ